MAGDRARRALSGTPFADVRWVDETTSTNADVLALARDGAPEGVVVAADHQTAGRGRRDRAWLAPARSSLLVSVLLRPPADRAGLCTFAAGVAMSLAIADVAGVPARLKWPNDVVVDDRKLGGILAEAEWSRGPDVAVVVGVGVNVEWPTDRPHDLAATAVALNDLVDGTVDREDLLVAFVRRLDERYPPEPQTLLDEWRVRSATLGRRVRVEIEGGSIVGTAVDVGVDGRLRVGQDDGRTVDVSAGDVVHLRPE
jgi:BirA family transcriptional regulator, biotin operon repressor / biotin---[acetyl-CoA-carboxylase] ligase